MSDDFEQTVVGHLADLCTPATVAGLVEASRR